MPLLYATTTAGLPGLFWPQLSGNFRATFVSARRVLSAGSSSPCVVRCRGDIRKAVVLPARNWAVLRFGNATRVSGFLEAVQSIRFIASAAL